MRTLFLKLYGALMASLLLALLAINALNNYFYEHEIKDEYLKQTSMFAQAIQREVQAGRSEAEVLAWWRKQLHNTEITLDLVATDPAHPQHKLAYIQKIRVSEAADQVEIMVPFDAGRALRFRIDDQVEPGAMLAYYGGYALLYLMLAGLVYALSVRLYRQIDSVRQQAHRVAAGDYRELPEPASSAGFAQLHHDLNAMSTALKQKTRDNQLLTAAIHHELRTPLTRLRLALDMAQFGTRPEQIPQLMQDMDAATSDLARLLDDILTLSRLRLAEQTVPRDTVALDAMLRQCSAQLDDPRIKMELLPCQLRANRALLERALSNLLENACKYGRQQISVHLQQTAEYLELVIEDDGPGIPAEQRTLVRQPFYRLAQHDSSVGGLGLGLAITDLALKESGADWQIEASPLGGSCMRLRWPCTETADMR